MGGLERSGYSGDWKITGKRERGREMKGEVGAFAGRLWKRS